MLKIMKMRILFSLLSFLICSFVLQAQIHLKDMSDETKQFFYDAKDCWENTEETCIPFYKKFVASAKAKNECVPCAEIELARGYFFESIIDSSLITIDTVLKNVKIQKDTLRLRIELDAYNLLGSIYNQQGKQQKAIEAYMSCGERIEKLNLKEHSALLNVNLGLLYLNMDDNKQAITLFESALKTLDELGITRQTAIINRNLALAYLAEDRIDDMLNILPKTLKLAKEQKSVNSEIAVYTFYAQAYETQQPDSSLYYANKAIDLAEASNRSNERAGALLSKANVLNHQGKYFQAKPLYIKSIDLHKNTSQTVVIRRIYRELGKSAYKYNDIETAAKYLNLYVQLNDSIADVETKKIVRELNTKYETEKKERQIAQQQLDIQKQKGKTQTTIFIGITLLILALAALILNRRNHKAKLKQIQQEKENAILNSFIKGEERERNRISYELHDGVASMISAAKMTLDSIPHLSVEKQKEQIEKVSYILSGTHSDVRHIAHNLLPTTLEQEKLIKATQQFVSEINQSNLLEIKVVDKNSNAQQLPQQIQLMLFRIIQELVNNIVKHSQAQHATIEFSQTQNGLQLEITDDGIGYSGENNENSQGIYSIRQRLKSIGGNFEIVKKSSQGTQAIVELKMT